MRRPARPLTLLRPCRAAALCAWLALTGLAPALAATWTVRPGERIQAAIDRLLCELDGSADKSVLGANALLAVSMASAHAGAAARGLPLRRLTPGAARAAGDRCVPRRGRSS